MKVQIDRLVSPFRIKMIAETGEDRSILKILSGKVSIASQFQFRSCSGHGSDIPGEDVTEIIVLQEVAREEKK